MQGNGRVFLHRQLSLLPLLPQSAYCQICVSSVFAKDFPKDKQHIPTPTFSCILIWPFGHWPLHNLKKVGGHIPPPLYLKNYIFLLVYQKEWWGAQMQYLEWDSRLSIPTFKQFLLRGSETATAWSVAWLSSTWPTLGNLEFMNVSWDTNRSELLQFRSFFVTLIKPLIIQNNWLRNGFSRCPDKTQKG